MSIEPPRYIYEDYRHWQGDWELIDGYPFAMAPSPYGKHQKLMGRLLHLRMRQSSSSSTNKRGWSIMCWSIPN